MDTLFEIQSLNFSYLDRLILDDLNLQINKSEITFILGANGAGKSTFLKILSAILQPSGGKVLLHGKDISAIDKNTIARKIAYISQESVFGFPFTVKEIVLLGRSPYIGRFEFEREIDNGIVQEAMELAGISHLQDRLISQISGGERQLVSFARAIAQQAEVMIIDEPGTFLDLKHKLKIFSVINKLVSEKDLSIIAATHDLASVMNSDANVVLLKNGSIICNGNPKDVMNEENISNIYDLNLKLDNIVPIVKSQADSIN